MSTRKPAGTPTETNLFVLREATADGTRDVPASVPSVDAPHLRRCLAAGLLAPTEGRALRLTDAGRVALDGYNARRARVAS